MEYWKDGIPSWDMSGGSSIATGNIKSVDKVLRAKIKTLDGIGLGGIKSVIEVDNY
jgi:hypothetical protein